MAGPNYKENKKLIPGEEEREREKKKVLKAESLQEQPASHRGMTMKKIRRSKNFCEGMEPPEKDMSSLQHQVKVTR